MTNKRIKTNSLDKAGMCVSVVCMVHCMSIPFLLVIGFDSVLSLVDQEWIEWTIIIVALFIGLGAFLSGYLAHRKHFVPTLFVAGFLLIINGESVVNQWVSLALSLSGAALVLYAHVQNLKYKRYVAHY